MVLKSFLDLEIIESEQSIFHEEKEEYINHCYFCYNQWFEKLLQHITCLVLFSSQSHLQFNILELESVGRFVCKGKYVCFVWFHSPGISALRRWKQEDQEFILGYISNLNRSSCAIWDPVLKHQKGERERPPMSKVWADYIECG